MKKVIVGIILILLIFVFWEDLADKYRQHFPEEEVVLPWIDRDREKLDLAIEGADFDASIVLFQDFEGRLRMEIKGIAENTGDDRKRHYRRQLVCELAALYKRIAMQYLQNGEELMYIEFMEKYRDELQKCTASLSAQ